MEGKHFFLQLDLSKVSVNKASREKTTVVIPFGPFQLNFMPFGLTNAGARLMDKVFGIWILYIY